MVGFPLLLIPARGLQHHRLPDAVRVLQRDVLFRGADDRGGETWPVTLADVMLALGIVLLLLEVVKGARPGSKFLMDHLLSLIVFGAAAAEFVMWPQVRQLHLFPAGAARDGRFPRRYRPAHAPPRHLCRGDDSAGAAQGQAPGRSGSGRRGARTQVRAGVCAGGATRAFSAVGRQSVLKDHPAPKPVNPPSPEIPSPDLQPGNGTPPSPDAPR